MKICDIRPTPSLRAYINRYWSWENEIGLPTMLPGTGAELMLHYGTALQLPNAGRLQVLPHSFLISPKTRLFPLQAHAAVGFLSVRFRAGALRHFCAESVCNLVDTPLDVRDIWGSAGAELEDQVQHACNLSARIKIVEVFLLRMLAAHSKPERWLDYTFERLYYRTRKLDEVIEEAPVSLRSFQQTFKRHAGISAKHFQKIARIESIIRSLLLARQTDYLGAALDHGYYDQAHFIRDFKSFAGTTPSAFLQEQNFSAHFYNQRLGE